MLVVASDPFAISTMAHAQYDILPFLDKTRASSFFALSSLFIPQTSICASLKAIFNTLSESTYCRGRRVFQDQPWRRPRHVKHAPGGRR